MQTLTYGSSVQTTLPMADAINRVRELLKEQGFNVICDIDVAKTLKEKVGIDFRPYVILGACNPVLAHHAILTESQIGLLLPCNIVIQVNDNATEVSVISVKALMNVVGNSELLKVAEEVDARLTRVLAGFTTAAQV